MIDIGPWGAQRPVCRWVARAGEADDWKLADATEDGRWVRGRRVEFFFGVNEESRILDFCLFYFLAFSWKQNGALA